MATWLLVVVPVRGKSAGIGARISLLARRILHRRRYLFMVGSMPCLRVWGLVLLFCLGDMISTRVGSPTGADWAF